MRRGPDALADGTFDLLILGGGITGAGVALDAALRGLRVALIDKGDFASGTSSVSSKLVHGGLRYLEHCGIRLVYEALRERRLLLRNAPHLVRPLRFVLPFYEGARVPAWKWRAGLTLYDLLAGSGNLRRSRMLRARHLQREFPNLQPRGLRGGAEYYDAQMDDARLCLAVLETASRHGACLANYVEAVDFTRSGTRVEAVTVKDYLGGNTFSVRARQVLNATGPWADRVARLAGDPGGPRLRPTNGVHLVVGDLGLRAAFLLLHPRDGRVFFVLPWMGKTLIGTTDTDTDESADDVAATPDDQAYLLEGYGRYFSPALEDRDVLNRFAGLRPLVRARAGNPSAVSREFALFESPSGLLTVAGGKYTTYRAMAEFLTDAVAARLGWRRRQRTRQCRLDGAPQTPWASFVDTEVARIQSGHCLDEATASHLVNRYGTRAEDVAHYLDGQPDLARPIIEGEPEIRAELAYARDVEMAVRPDDFLLRRTRLGLFHPGIVIADWGHEAKPHLAGSPPRTALTGGRS